MGLVRVPGLSFFFLVVWFPSHESLSINLNQPTHWFAEFCQHSLQNSISSSESVETIAHKTLISAKQGGVLI